MEAYRYRATQGVWVNDMRQKGMPSYNWPCNLLDEDTESGIKAAIDTLGQSGFNILTTFGLIYDLFLAAGYKKRAGFREGQKGTQDHRICAQPRSETFRRAGRI